MSGGGAFAAESFVEDETSIIQEIDQDAQALDAVDVALPEDVGESDTDSLPEAEESPDTTEISGTDLDPTDASNTATEPETEAGETGDQPEAPEVPDNSSSSPEGVESDAQDETGADTESADITQSKDDDEAEIKDSSEETTNSESKTEDAAEVEADDKLTSEDTADMVYTLHLTHVLRFTLDGKNRSIQISEAIELTEADFEDGVCDLNKFAYEHELLTVTQANPLSKDSFTANREGGARILYAVKDGWKVVRKDSATIEGDDKLRSIFQGALGDYEFVPANVVRINVSYKYSNTGGLAGMDAASPQVIEAVPEKQENGTYKVVWNLPATPDGFRVVLNSSALNRYLKNPPTGNETAAELEAALDRGDFDVDVDNYTIYYYQETPGEEEHPTYKNRYSTEYNRAWNEARILNISSYTAEALCGGDSSAHPAGAENHGANPLVDPKLEVILTEAQLADALKSEVGLDVAVYYRRNATGYTVNHWVPTVLSGKSSDEVDALPADKKKTENETDYVLLDQETLQGRVGAMTRAAAKIDGVYERLESESFSQKLIANAGTTVDIYYKALKEYRVIFDTNYTYIPRQTVPTGQDVNFDGISVPSRTGYTFAGWRYLKKDAIPNADGSYNNDQYEELNKDNPSLTINMELIAKAKLTETGGTLALHLYPKWEPATTKVRVTLWTEDLTGTDDVQAVASGGNTNYYSAKYANYSEAPVTHDPQLGMSDSHYSNMGSFTIDIATDSPLKDGVGLVADIQARVTKEFTEKMGKASEIDVASFYTQADFEIVHEEEAGTNYNASTASGDGKTMIYVYFTRNIYELLFTYYGSATVNGYDSAYCVATSTNGYSYSNGAAVPGGNLTFDYDTSHAGGNGTNYSNGWMRASVTAENQMPVPKTITIKAKYGADLRDVWPVARAQETFSDSLDNPGDRGTTARMISWGTTAGKYCEGGFFNSGKYNAGEPTIMGTYAAMSAEIVADPKNPSLRHNLVAYWFNGNISHYRNNHCFEIPDLNVAEMQRVSIYNNDTSDERNFLYLVPINNDVVKKYDFNDLMLVSYNNGSIIYNDPDGTYYAVRAYNGKYYAVARQVATVSSNTIAKQNPSARLHMTRANTTADHSTQYADENGAYNGTTCGTEAAPYDLYFYYDRDRYTISYMVPTNKDNAAETEYLLGTIELPYGAMVTQEKYGFSLNYTDKNTNSAYDWTHTDETAVCPDRATNGTAVWKFKGWGLGPAGLNMQWTVNEDAQVEAQAGEDFPIEGNLRLYAIWGAPTYTVTFHLNGGHVEDAQATAAGKIEESVPANRRYSSTEAEIPRPFSAGHTFLGWFVANENGEPIDADGNVVENPDQHINDKLQSFDFDQDVAANYHVVAVWNPPISETFNYKVYCVTDNPNEADEGNETVWINNNDKIVDQVSGQGKKYYVLKEDYRTNVPITSEELNLSTSAISGYVPKNTNAILDLREDSRSEYVVFYYDRTTTDQHVVRFVEAGTERNTSLRVVKELTVQADQTVVTPKSAVAKELVGMGYALVNRDNSGTGYTEVKNANDLQWLDERGLSNPVSTLTGEAIPSVITYLVKPIPYTITYKNAAGSPAGADDALAVITSGESTPVANAGDKNPTQYTTKDSFTAKNPAPVTENGKQYRFSHWSLGDSTAEVRGSISFAAAGNATFSTLKIDPGTVGNLTFVANWVETTDNGILTVTKTVAGNAGDQNAEFHFTVILDDRTVNGAYGDMTFTNGMASFTLKHSESKTAQFLPENMGYTVIEREANQDGYTTTSTDDAGRITEAGATAAFVNTRDRVTPPPTPTPETGNLSVSKTVTGDEADTTTAFPFTVTVDDVMLNGTYGDMTFQNGVATFTLSHGQNVLATGLPAGINYTVEEADNEEYTVTATGDTGTIAANITATAAFINHKGDEEVDLIDVTVNKVWKLDDDGTAADSVTIVLYGDNEEYARVILNASNNWAYTWTELSSETTWTVAEVDIPEGFTASIVQDGMNFTITNDDDPAVPDEPVEPIDPAYPVDPDSPDDPVTPEGPTSPEEPFDPNGPTGPDEPTGHLGPGGPGDPTSPNAPTGPQGPTGPTAAPQAPSAILSQTGDSAPLVLLLAVCAITGVAAVALIVSGRRKKQ